MNPGLPNTPRVRPPPGTPPGDSFARLPLELRYMIYDDYMSKNSLAPIMITTYRIKGRKASRGVRRRPDQTWFRVVRGPALLLSTRWIEWEMDLLRLLRRRQRSFYIRVDLSSADYADSIRGMIDLLRTDALMNKIWAVEFTGWTSMSFRGLVYMIHDHGAIDHIRIAMVSRVSTWMRCYDGRVRAVLHNFLNDVTMFGRFLPVVAYGRGNIETVANRVWNYLHPTLPQPGFSTQNWRERKQIEGWMNESYHRCNSVEEALQKS